MNGSEVGDLAVAQAENPDKEVQTRMPNVSQVQSNNNNPKVNRKAVDLK